MSEMPEPRHHLTVLRAETTALLIVDIQERLVPAIHEGQRVIDETVRLIEGCNALDVPVLATEQYPKGLGFLVPQIRERVDSDGVFEKTTFSVGGCEKVMRAVTRFFSPESRPMCAWSNPHWTF